MDKVTICSLNVRGLGDYKKRRDVLNYLRMKKFSIICLQDTHFTPQVLSQIQREWGYKCFHSTFKSNARGTSIFITNTFEFKLNGYIEDPNGNHLILDINIEDKRILLISIYAPNKDTPTFFHDLQKNILDQNVQNIMIVGDWNLVLEPLCDSKNYKHLNNPNARKTVCEMKTKLNLVDTWRENNKLKRQFTWKRKLPNGIIQSARLDFFLVSENMMQYVFEDNISSGYRSDHSVVSLSLRFNQNNRGKGFWKFNNSLLGDIIYVNLVKTTILDVKKQYAASPYNQEKIKEIPNALYQPIINDQLFFEMLLLEIRSKTISFSINKKRNTRNRMTELIKKLKNLKMVKNH